MKTVILLGLRFYYRVLSIDHGWLGRLIPHGGKVCRFEPTCSEYMIQAVEEYGVMKGVGLGLKRLSKCQPWGGFGYDPVPGRS